MPSLRSIFQLQSAAAADGLQEEDDNEEGEEQVEKRFCDLTIDSPRFVHYIDLLDAAVTECEYEGYRYPDIGRFVDYFERKCSLRDCRRQRQILATWHYISELPEFTVCEDCYDDVVRPLLGVGGGSQNPIAKRLPE